MYEQHRLRIAEELALTPSPETRKLLFKLCSPTTDAEQFVIDRVSAHLDTLGSRPATVHAPPVRRRTWAPAYASALAIALLMTFAVQRESTDEAPTPVRVALMNFGDQQDPAIRALPGLVATYLIRDSAVDITYGESDGNRYRVEANIAADDADSLSGTVQVRTPGGKVVSTLALKTADNADIDTAAAQIANFIAGVVHPDQTPATPELALSAAQQHLLFARADYARGAAENARLELGRATSKLDSVRKDERHTEWRAVSAAIVREQQWQAGN